MAAEKDKVESAVTQPVVSQDEEKKEDAVPSSSAAADKSLQEKVSSFLDSLAFPGAPGTKWVSLGILASASSIVVGTTVYGLKRAAGHLAERSRAWHFAHTLRKESSSIDWSKHFMNFLADASSHIPQLRTVWQTSAEEIKKGPHQLLQHDTILDQLSIEERKALLVILREYRNDYYQLKLHTCMALGDNDWREGNYREEKNPGQQRKDALQVLHDEITVLTHREDQFCERYGLSHLSSANLVDLGWQRRMQALLDAVKEDNPDFKPPFDAKNIILLTAHDDFMHRLNSFQIEELSDIFDLYSTQSAMGEIAKIFSPLERKSIDLARELLSVAPHEVAKHSQWHNFTNEEQEALQKVYTQVMADKIRKQMVLKRAESI